MWLKLVMLRTKYQLGGAVPCCTAITCEHKTAPKVY